MHLRCKGVLGANLVPALEQVVRQVRSDEARPARDEDSPSAHAWLRASTPALFSRREGDFVSKRGNRWSSGQWMTLREPRLGLVLEPTTCARPLARVDRGAAGVVLDGRSVFDPAEMRALGFRYQAI